MTCVHRFRQWESTRVAKWMKATPRLGGLYDCTLGLRILLRHVPPLVLLRFVLQRRLDLLRVTSLGEVEQDMQVSWADEVLAAVHDPRDDRDDGWGSACTPLEARLVHSLTMPSTTTA